MGSQVSLPLWVVVLIGVLAILGALDRILIPSVRWALRRRANRAIEELNTRLKLRIQPFKLTKRQVLTDRLVFDPGSAAGGRGVFAPKPACRTKSRWKRCGATPARSCRRSAPMPIFASAPGSRGRFRHMLYRVRIGVRNDEALAAVDPASSVIFVINHRSNMDYVLVTYVAATSSALSYAVGEWAQVWGAAAT